MHIQWRKLLVWATWKARKGWLTPGVPVVALLVAYGFAKALQYADPAEATFRLAGMFLQLGGLVIVAEGLRSTQRQFRAPGVTQGVIKWAAEGKVLLRRPEQRQIYDVILPITVNVFDDSIHLKPLQVQQSLQQQLQTLAENLETTTQALVVHRRSVEQELSKLGMEISTAQHDRIKDVGNVRQTLTDFSTGGLILEWIGLIWLLLGTLFGAIPQELGEFAASWAR